MEASYVLILYLPLCGYVLHFTYYIQLHSLFELFELVPQGSHGSHGTQGT